MRSHAALLAELARDCGIQRTYRDGLKQRRTASRDALQAVLVAFGAPAATTREAAESLSRRRRARWQRPAEPVAVVRHGAPGRIGVRMPASFDGRVTVTVEAEDGGRHVRHEEAPALPIVAKEDVDGRAFVQREMEIPAGIPHGYHRTHVEAAEDGQTTLIVAPARMHDGPRAAGVFVPMYAIRGARDFGCGDLGSFAELSAWIAARGGSLVATLPILAAFLDRPFDPSPYAPVSRLHWNELYVDLEAVPEFAASEEARSIAAAHRSAIARLRRKGDVDYRAVSAIKRSILEACERSVAGERRRALELFVRAHPSLRDYARFRAAVERTGTSWPRWERSSPRGDAGAERFHQYVQWLMHEQLSAAGRAAEAAGVHLYFDLPLGVHPEGFDTRRFGELFAFGVAGGAPPDGFFTRGQNWDFPPLHPERLRDTGYAYAIESLRTLLRHARILRIDHVMGLHRLFWVPDGFDATDGVYVRSHPDEWYAILALESHRAGAAIVGEDLGTVPGEVRRAMARNNVLRSYVLQEEIPDRGRPAPRPIPRRALAALNTHDMPTFASFWQGRDVDDRIALGLLTPDEAEAERAGRGAARRRVAATFRAKKMTRARGELAASDALDASLRWLAAGSARIRCVSIEDLWLEERQQNVPGTTGEERPNWRHKLRPSLDEIRRDPAVAARVETLTRR